MKLLGLSAGNANGSAEILLKEALRAAEAAGAEIELVRLADLRLSTGPASGADDADWFWDRLMGSDGLIVSTPIYTRTIPGLLRLLGDKISGPQSDVAFTAEILRMRASGQPLAVDFAVDERVLRPRVAGFIAVGGSLPTRWKSLALPLLHTLTASAQIAVVDQVEFAGAGSPASIVLQPDALARARQLGDAVGSQLGRTYELAEYRGEPGLCPLCHLSVVVIRGSTAECAACGATGTFDGSVSFTGLNESVLSREEKLDHFHEVQQTAAAHAEHRAEITARAAEYAAWDPPGDAVSVVRDIPFVSYPGFRPLSLDLHLPDSAGPLPVILELHGGGWRMGTRSVFTPLVSEARSFGRIVAAGFAVVAVDYRLSGEAHFPAQVDDVLAALDWIAAHADEHGLDASRIVLWGGSAGGTLAALAGIRRPSAVRGVIDWYGPSALLAMPRVEEPSREDLWLGAPVPSVPELATAASPARQVIPGLPPFHLAHGLDDTDVPPAQSELLAAALRGAGVEVELHLEAGAGHFWKGATEAATDALFDRAIAFAERVTA